MVRLALSELSRLRAIYRARPASQIARIGLITAAVLLVLVSTTGDVIQYAADVEGPKLFGPFQVRRVLELYGYVMLGAVPVLMLVAFVKTRLRSYLFVALLFAFLLVDDALGYHDTVGKYLANSVHIPGVPALLTHELGQILAWVIAVCTLIPLLLWCLRRRRPADFGVYALFAAIVSVLILLTGGIDSVRIIITTGNHRQVAMDYLLGWVQDCGALLTMSLAAAAATGYMVDALTNAPRVESHRVRHPIAAVLALVLGVALMQPLLAARMVANGDAEVISELEMERAIPALDTIWMEEMTWLEVRDALAAQKRTAIVPAGGVEQAGPHVATGKHNLVLEGMCERVARALGDALCTPIVKLVPEGGISTPTGHERYPGTLGVRQETFEATLEDLGRDLHRHGFEWVVYIGDSGSNQQGLSVVADRLNADWGAREALYIPEYYDNAGMQRHLKEKFGIVEEDEGWHDSYWLSAMLAAVDPDAIRYKQRVQADLAAVNGVSLIPLKRTVAVGEELMRWRTEQTVSAIQAAKGQ